MFELAILGWTTKILGWLKNDPEITLIGN